MSTQPAEPVTAPAEPPGERLLTSISQENLFDPVGFWSKGEHRVGTSRYWFDELFRGGIYHPEKLATHDGRALTILITGAPGTGKSILAMEMCYRWCLHGHTSVYITNEEHPPWIVEKADDLGWSKARSLFRAVEASPTGQPLDDQACVRVVRLDEHFPTTGRNAGLATRFRQLLYQMLGGPSPPAQNATGAEQGDAARPMAVVLDSLNTVDTSDRGKLFKSFLDLHSSGPRVIIAILDSPAPGGASEFWEFASDVVIRLGFNSGAGYNLRTFEIVKARYQSHVWGPHQLKIYERPKLSGGAAHGNSLDDNDENRALASELSRAFPHRSDGGIAIFPSIHYVLSFYKRQQFPVMPGAVPSPLPTLNKILAEGFPRGRCTAFLGQRGGHKSHLGSCILLWQLDKERQKSGPGSSEPANHAIIVSLRDDEILTVNTLVKAQCHQLQLDHNNEEVKERVGSYIEQLRKDGFLDIMYFPPGYITPEEFFHRILSSIRRIKPSTEPPTKTSPRIALLFNSLDQLDSRFPLCAREKIFMPGLVQMLRAEGVTSFFIAAGQPGPDHGGDFYGLDSLAEAILRFDATTIGSQRRRNAREVVRVTVDRFAGGQAAGASGVLEYVDSTAHRGYSRHKKLGLHFVADP